jgi:hypothetical protein
LLMCSVVLNFSHSSRVTLWKTHFQLPG